MKTMNRFLSVAVAVFLGVILLSSGHWSNPEKMYRGIVLYPSDIVSSGPLTVVRWMREAGLNLLGIHSHSESEDLDDLRTFIESKAGQVLLEECRKNRISIEFESHVIREILPRDLFGDHPDYFPQDENGVRQKEHNMCFTSEGAYHEIEKNITELVKWLKPTTHRYFLWTDDGAAFCHCQECRKYSESELTLLYENRVLAMLRKSDPLATMAHLAYYNTLEAPVRVGPSDGIFLEFAPINRDYAGPLPEEHLIDLKENLKVFPVHTAHVLEYWVDASMFSGWDREKMVRVPWDTRNCERDVKMYISLGIRSVTSFGTWTVNRDYFMKFGEESARQLIREYGSVLKDYL